MSDVAHRAGVSIATVSRALRGVPGVSGTTRERVLRIADELAYVISPEASRLARRVTGRVAVVVPRIDVWFYAAMLSSLETELRAADLDVLVYQVDGRDQRSRFFRDLPHVLVDDHDVARRAVTHLVTLGHTRIAMIRTSDTDGTAWSSDILRRHGYRDILARHGLTVPDDYLVTRPFGVRAGRDAMELLLDLPTPPTAVFAYSDELAVGAFRTAIDRGLRIPADLSIVGVDGNPLAELFGITTVTQFVAEQGRLAGRMAIAMLRGESPGEHVLVPSELVVRASTGPVPAG